MIVPVAIVMFPSSVEADSNTKAVLYQEFDYWHIQQQTVCLHAEFDSTRDLRAKAFDVACQPSTAGEQRFAAVKHDTDFTECMGLNMLFDPVGNQLRSRS